MSAMQPTDLPAGDVAAQGETVPLVPASTPENSGQAPTDAQRAQPPSPQTAAASSSESRPTAGRLLIIDDEPANVQVLKRYLQGAGYTDIPTTTESTTAFQLIERCKPDLVLLDVNMPSVSGIDILGQVRRHPRLRYLPVIIITANTDSETKRQCLELGATDFLNKPVEPFDLLPRVRNTLVTKGFQDQLARYAHVLERRVRERTRELELSRKEVVECLARAAEYRDTETGNHVLRVGKYAGIIAKELGFSEEEVNHIELAAQLHDVGKIAIPDAILHKPGRLDADEFEYMQRHSAIGHSIVRPHDPQDGEKLRTHVFSGGQLLAAQSSPLLRLAATIALSHHERWDGTGYPLGLKGTDIPIEARITSVADVFDALSSVRPYKKAMPREQCFSILEEGRGSQFDPDVLTAFFARSEEIVQVQQELVDIPPV